METCISKETLGEALYLYTFGSNESVSQLYMPWDPLPTCPKVIKLDLWQNVCFSVEYDLGEREIFIW